MVRFIHAADLHIDRSFEGLSALKEYQAFFYITIKQCYKHLSMLL